VLPAVEHLRVLSLIPGRIRVHLLDWTGDDGERIEHRLGRLRGVESVEVNPLTGNALIRFDRQTTDEKALLMELDQTREGLAAEQRREAVTSPLLRIGARGLLGHAVVDSFWFAAGFLGEALGLPLAALGPLHLLTDLAVWTVALGSSGPTASVGPAEPRGGARPGNATTPPCPRPFSPTK
jgi:hypothetical protein